MQTADHCVIRHFNCIVLPFLSLNANHKPANMSIIKFNLSDIQVYRIGVIFKPTRAL